MSHRTISSKLSQYIDHGWRYLFGTPRRKRSEVLPNLYLGGQLYSLGVQTLRRWGITAVVSLRTSIPRRFLTSHNFALLHLPVPEHTAPSLDQLCQGVAFIDQEIARGGKVYVHCLYGEGRGPTMVLAYLLSQGYAFEKAWQHVLEIRPFIQPSQTQLHQLQLFAEYKCSLLYSEM